MNRHQARRWFLVAFLTPLATLVLAGRVSAKGSPPAVGQARDGKADVSALLQEFLARVDSAAMHARFWADDLIYVSNAGVVRTKADILKGMKPDEPAAVPPAAMPATRPASGYSAEDVTVRQFGEAVVVNFRLVQRAAGQPETSYRNSGVFVLRDGRWQVVSWQATRVAPPAPKQ